MKHFKLFAMGTLAVSTFVLADTVGAQALTSVDINERVRASTGLANNLGFLIQALVALVGFIVMCIGLYGCYKMNDQNPGNFTWGKALSGALVGAALFFLPLTLGTLGNTLFGTTERGTPIRVAPGQ